MTRIPPITYKWINWFNNCNKSFSSQIPCNWEENTTLTLSYWQLFCVIYIRIRFLQQSLYRPVLLVRTVRCLFRLYCPTSAWWYLLLQSVSQVSLRCYGREQPITKRQIKLTSPMYQCTQTTLSLYRASVIRKSSRRFITYMFFTHWLS